MDDELYREYILEHYKRPHNWGELEHPDLEARDLNPLCGDELQVQLAVDGDGKISDVAFSGHGCAISQASASMVSDEVKGMKVSELLSLDRSFVLEMLQAGANLVIGQFFRALDKEVALDQESGIGSQGSESAYDF